MKEHRSNSNGKVEEKSAQSKNESQERQVEEVREVELNKKEGLSKDKDGLTAASGTHVASAASGRAGGPP